MHKKKILGVICLDTNHILKYYTSKKNIEKVLPYLFDTIIIETSTEPYASFLKKDILTKNIQKYIFSPNSGKGDIEPLCTFLKDFHYSPYDYVFFMTDKIFLNDSISGFFDLIMNGMDAIPFYSLIDSYEYKYHLSDSLFFIKSKMVPVLVSFFQIRYDSIQNNRDYVVNVRTEIMNLFPLSDCYIKCRESEPEEYPFIYFSFFTSPFYENKSLPEDFDPEEYKDLHSDLQHLDNEAATNHFLKYGIQESRLYKHNQVFKYSPYIQNAFDSIYCKEKESEKSALVKKILSRWDENQDKSYFEYFHYTKLFKIIPIDFEIDEYRQLNPDLENVKNSELYDHFLKMGQYENRMYSLEQKKEYFVFYNHNINLPTNFDAQMYKKLHPDLESLDDEEAEKHFINIGVKEGRVYHYRLIEHLPYMSYLKLESIYNQIKNRIRLN